MRCNVVGHVVEHCPTAPKVVTEIVSSPGMAKFGSSGILVRSMSVAPKVVTEIVSSPGMAKFGSSGILVSEVVSPSSLVAKGVKGLVVSDLDVLAPPFRRIKVMLTYEAWFMNFFMVSERLDASHMILWTRGNTITFDEVITMLYAEDLQLSQESVTEPNVASVLVATHGNTATQKMMSGAMHGFPVTQPYQNSGAMHGFQSVTPAGLGNHGSGSIIGQRQGISQFGIAPQAHFTGAYQLPYIIPGTSEVSSGAPMSTQSVSSGGLSQQNSVPSYGGMASQPWYFDSGATHHITNSLQNLNIAQPVAYGEGIMVGNGTQIPVTHTGKAGSVSGNVPLTCISAPSSVLEPNTSSTISAHLSPVSHSTSPIVHQHPEVVSFLSNDHSPSHLSSDAPTQCDSVSPAPVLNSHPMLTRAKHGIRKPNPLFALSVVSSSDSLLDKEPNHFTSAIKFDGANPDLGLQFCGLLDKPRSRPAILWAAGLQEQAPGQLFSIK
ncbi:hypothetical protein Vadar_005129 [Vaccinium darrowii]|uniref:Uncharacterized protein n=1 Tax=Vaccinium darrowii TaxID=229202 RepID=A0ACB7Z945_9ERIC|nr:hypothetical protein Vadar_005129 [Vaccinium darrowii]